MYKKHIYYPIFFGGDGMNGNFGGGDGSFGNPYILQDAFDLNAIRNFSDACFMQDRDIDMNISPFSSGEGFLPIPQFSGFITGSKFNIKNLYINRPTSDYVGIFGKVKTVSRGDVAEYIERCQLKNITIENANVVGNEYVGCIAGQNEYSIISNCKVLTSTLTVNSQRGGMIVGASWGELDHCYSSGTLNSLKGTPYGDNQYFGTTQMLGGLVGSIGNMIEVQYCGSSVTINTHASTVGGLIGEIEGAVSDNSIIHYCFFDGYINSNGSNIGGIVGKWDLYNNNGLRNFQYCTSSGTVISTAQSVGGILGLANNPYGTIHIVDCFTSGIIQGGKETSIWGKGVGGILGNTPSQSPSQTIIERCHSTASVSAYSDVAGISGSQWSTVTIRDCFANNDSITCTSGVGVGRISAYSVILVNNRANASIAGNFESGATLNGINGLTVDTNTLKTKTIYEAQGWNFGNGVWSIHEGVSYPFFAITLERKGWGGIQRIFVMTETGWKEIAKAYEFTSQGWNEIAGIHELTKNGWK